MQRAWRVCGAGCLPQHKHALISMREAANSNLSWAGQPFPCRLCNFACCHKCIIRVGVLPLCLPWWKSRDARCRHSISPATTQVSFITLFDGVCQAALSHIISADEFWHRSLSVKERERLIYLFPAEPGGVNRKLSLFSLTHRLNSAARSLSVFTARCLLGLGS